MDKVVSRQTHFKRALEKQLNEIEVNKRQNEARRLKEIRDLGVDLSRIQKTTRDLEFVDDPTLRRPGQRRSSLPALDSSGFSLDFDSSRAPRSRRRLSCIAAIPLASPFDDEHLQNSRPKIGMTTPEDKQLPPIIAVTKENSFSASATTECRGESRSDDRIQKPTTKSTKPPSERKKSYDSAEVDTVRPMVKRGSIDQNGNCSNRANNSGHNVTTVHVHENKLSPSQDKTSSDEQTSEADLEPMLELIKSRGRRASEPAVGGFFIRRLQANEFNEALSLPQRNAVESEELKRMIQKNLPSDIVAEEDEDEKENDEVDEATEIVSVSSSSSLQSSSVLESDRHSAHSKDSFASKPKNGKVAPKDKNKTPKANQVPTKTESVNSAGQRRKSEGDVLSHYNSRKLHFESKNQAWKSKGNARGASAVAKNKYSFDDSDNGKTEVWQAVRKCRYLRGYDPPEMSEPGDVAEFVFGHGEKDSFPPKSK